jgi:TPR repeat protein
MRTGWFKGGKTDIGPCVWAVLAFLILSAHGQTLAAELSVPELVSKIKASVVWISQTNKDKKGSSATGFFVTPTGYFVTNYHVLGSKALKKSNVIETEIVTSSGRHYRVVGALAENEAQDIAVGKVELPKGELAPYLRIKTAAPIVGEQVVVVGNPAGLAWTASQGIVSALRPNFNNLGSLKGDYIQHNAPATYGSSGSPVVNAQGWVVGVHSSSRADNKYSAGILLFASAATNVLALKSKTGASIGDMLRKLYLEESLAAFDKEMVEGKTWEFYPTAYNRLGNEYLDLGRTQDAARCYREAVLYSPRYGAAHYNLGLAYWRMKYKDSYLTQCHILEAIDNQRADSLRKIGSVTAPYKPESDPDKSFKLPWGGTFYRVTGKTFESQIAQSKLPALVFFGAAWCGKCRSLVPVIEELTTLYNGKAKIARFDAGADKETPAKYSINQLPAAVAFKEGYVVEQITGDMTRARLQGLMAKVFQWESPVAKAPLGSDEYYEKLADRGDAQAQYHLAEKFFWGKSAASDVEKAVGLYRRAAQQGNAKAQTQMGFAYQYGLGIARDRSEAAKWYQKASEQGYAPARHLLSAMLAHASGLDYATGKLPSDCVKEAQGGNAQSQTFLADMYYSRHAYEKAFEWYGQAAEKRDAQAQFELGKMYDLGEGVAPNYGEALKWYQKAAEQGFVPALHNLGAMYESGKGAPKDVQQAILMYRKAAEAGLPQAQVVLGVRYERGEGVARDYGEALKWYSRAAEQGLASAQRHVGYMYESGRGVPRDSTEAARWYQKAAEQGDPRGENNLGALYAKGEGVEQHLATAFKWYHKAAAHGDVYGQVNLAYCYYRGKGVAQNYGEAARWYRKAAENGSALAQNSLGVMYQQGMGVVKDDGEAFQWFLKAAQGGSAWGQANLAAIYQKGKGVAQDEVQAAQWYRKAAEQGNAMAQYQLGMMYALGQGVGKDDEESRQWLRKAADQGYPQAVEQLEKLDKSPKDKP